jgi:2-methylcitrate dehydratase PrpD
MPGVASRGIVEQLSGWATDLVPTEAEEELAQRSLVDTLAVTLAARKHPITRFAGLLGEAASWGAAAHVLDFDDLHLESTAHISAVCVPATLACGGDGRAYLAGAGVMARLGALLGWTHYQSGWHATCTAGAPAAAVAAAVSLGLGAAGIARAAVLAIPAAGGVQRAFGTEAKALQVGFAVAAGVRAAHLAAAGASADPRAMDQWLSLVHAEHTELTPVAEAVPGGLAIKMFPCCYALQRPICAMREFHAVAGDLTRIVVETPSGTLQPLIHHRPATGLEAKFSLEYAIAATVLDGYPDFASFEDSAVGRATARTLVELVDVRPTAGGSGLLDGELVIELHHRSGQTERQRLRWPVGSPASPPTPAELHGKLLACGADVPGLLESISWEAAPGLLRAHLSTERPVDRHDLDLEDGA